MNTDLLRFKKNQKYLVFDFETCGLNLASTENKPWQLAFMVTEGKKVVKQCDYMIKWKTLNISEGAARATGFNRKRYESKSVDPVKVLDEFEKYLYDEDYVIVGHNLLGFDIYIHNIYRKLLGKSADYSYVNRIVDTLCISKAQHKNIKLAEGEERINWQYRLTNFRERGMKVSLKAMCKINDIEFNESKLHDALYDIKLNKQVFEKLIWQVEV